MTAYGKRRARASSEKPRKVRKGSKKEPETRKRIRKGTRKTPAKHEKPKRKKTVAPKKTAPKRTARKRKPVAKKPAARKRKPIAKKPTKKPAARKRKPIAKKPAARKRKPIARKPAARKRKPVSKKPVAKKPKLSPLERARRKLRRAIEEAKKRKTIRKYPRLPKRMRRTDRVDEGEQRRVQIDRILTPQNVSEIVYRVERVVSNMSGLFPLWLGTLEISGLGEKLLGYGQQLLESRVSGEDDEEDDLEVSFSYHAFDSTGVYGSSQGLLHALETMLDRYASDRTTVVFLHSVKIMNFRRR